MRADYSMFDVIVDGAVARVSLHENGSWAGRHRFAEIEEVIELVADIAADDAVNVLLVLGTRTRFGPAKELPADVIDLDRASAYRIARGFVHAVIGLDKPLVVALTGDPSGIWLSLALLGDIVVAERHVQLRDAHVLGGFVSATGPLIWPVSVGLLKAKRYLLTGESITADEAEALGLLTEVVDDGGAPNRAMEYAAALASRRPYAVRETKHALNHWLRANVADMFDPTLALQFIGAES